MWILIIWKLREITLKTSSSTIRSLLGLRLKIMIGSKAPILWKLKMTIIMGMIIGAHICMNYTFQILLLLRRKLTTESEFYVDFYLSIMSTNYSNGTKKTFAKLRGSLGFNNTLHFPWSFSVRVNREHTELLVMQVTAPKF